MTNYLGASWGADLGGGSDPAIGILGGDLWRNFAFSLDYRMGRAWIADDTNPTAAPTDLDADDPIAVPIDVAGGGTSIVPGNCSGATGCGLITLPSTRVILTAKLEGTGDPIWVLVDSGASAMVLDDTLYASLPSAGRPILDGVTVDTVMGPQDAFLSRVSSLSLTAPTPVTLTDIPILVIPGSTLLQGLEAEVGHKVQALVGGSFLRWYWTTFDYPKHELRLGKYKTTPHIPAHEFQGLGFTMLADTQGNWVVTEVYPDFDAAAQGVVVGDTVVQLNGMPIMGVDGTTVQAIIDGFSLGQEVPVQISDGATTSNLMILIQDLLPDYPGP
jgi:hypothetical protein